MSQPNIQLHFLQTEILKKLSLSPKLKFNQLLIPNLESVHMNYHLQKLKTFGLVVNENEFYTLTDLGKDYSNQLDDLVKTIEKQPKTSVLLNVIRKNDEGEIEFLLTKRLKQPFYGKIMELTGKVRFGETLEQAAKRELVEETGLVAKKAVLESVFHIMRHRDSGEVVQDVIFYVFFVSEFEGNFVSKLPYQENFWISKKEFENQKDIDTFKDLHLVERLEAKPLIFKEIITLAEGY